MKRRGFFVSGAALIGAVALTLSGALPASAGTLNTGGRSCNSGYYAQTWGYYNSVGTHKQFTGSWHTQYVGNAYLKWSGSSAGTQSFSSGNVTANTLQYVTTDCG